MKTVHYPLTNQWVGTMTCPSCCEVVRAWRSSGMSECWPHFYCDKCSNAIHREADQGTAWNQQSLEVLQAIADTLPDCPCGGHFKPGANPKCRACRAEFAHQKDVVSRLTDPHVILIHGACLLSDKHETYRVEIG